MNLRAKASGRNLLIIAVVLLLGLVSVALIFRHPETPHVTATFLSFPDTLRPRVAEFQIINQSSRLVHFQGYQFIINSVPEPHQSETILPGQSTIVSLTVPEPLEAHTQLELIFRRQDTSAEEAREMLDSVLRAVHIRIPGLNPDSSTSLFKLSVTIPTQTKSGNP
jgi:hypothetical protein